MRAGLGTANVGAKSELVSKVEAQVQFPPPPPATALKDGGGLGSTLDWQSPSPTAKKDPLQKVRQAIWGALPRGTLAKLSQAGDTGLSQALFSAKEVSQLRAAVCQALGTDVAWAEQTFELTPYKFHLVKALAAQIGDIDVELCDILKVGAPTGVRQRVPPSGVWPLCEGEWEVHADFDIDLQWCRHNHASADSDEKSVAALIQKEMDAGFMELVGDEAAVRKRFPSGQLAVGKLGVVRSAGKDDRLIGDSRSSGASPAAKFSERAELPSLYHFGAALSSRHSDWSLFSLDIKGAHKSIRTAREDTGFSVFQFQGQYYVYLVNHFGAAWSAYWWSRLGGLLMRLAHHLLRHKHLGGVCG